MFWSSGRVCFCISILDKKHAEMHPEHSYEVESDDCQHDDETKHAEMHPEHSYEVESDDCQHDDETANVTSTVNEDEQQQIDED